MILVAALLIGCRGIEANPSNSSGSSGASSGSTGGCDGVLCMGMCCPSGTECANSPDAGIVGCALICMKPTDCGVAEPCCTPDYDPISGAYTGHGACGPVLPGPQFCHCADASDCNALFGAGSACVPLVSGHGVFIGPSICAFDDGNNFDGCAPEGDGGDPSHTCTMASLACTTDAHGNQFCSSPCTLDSDCRNPGVACCNGTCGRGQCCGLCEN